MSDEESPKERRDREIEEQRIEWERSLREGNWSSNGETYYGTPGPVTSHDNSAAPVGEEYTYDEFDTWLDNPTDDEIRTGVATLRLPGVIFRFRRGSAPGDDDKPLGDLPSAGETSAPERPVEASSDVEGLTITEAAEGKAEALEGNVSDLRTNNATLQAPLTEALSKIPALPPGPPAKPRRWWRKGDK